MLSARPLIMIGSALGLGVLGWAVFGRADSKHPADGAAVPNSVVLAVAAAIKSGDPATMKQVAAKLRADGYSAQASSLEEAAVELAAAINGTPETRAGRALPAPRVGLPNPAPRADSTAARQQAGALAQLLAGMTVAQAHGSSKVAAATRDYQTLEKKRGFYVGNIDGQYGPKTALTLANDHGIVPPEPVFWPKKDPATAKKVYATNLARFAAADPQRSEEWTQAMHVTA